MITAKHLNYSFCDINVHIISDSRTTLLKPGRFEPYATSDFVQPDVRIEYRSGLDPKLLENTAKQCTATHNDFALWEIYSKDTSFYVVTYDQLDSHEMNQIAVTEFPYMDWIIYSRSDSESPDGVPVVEPLKFPMCSLFLYHQTLCEQSLIIHASGVFDAQTGRLFTGRSGVGKSTMARLWAEHGNALIINDDRLYLRKVNDQWMMYNTPMMYPQIPLKAPLNHIYVLNQALDFDCVSYMTPVAVGKVFGNCIVQTYNRNHVDHHFKVIESLIQSVSVNVLSSRANPEVLEGVRTFESTLPRHGK
jgi:hypothetical protein